MRGLSHKIVIDFKRVKSDLGRTPSKEEYLISGAFSEYTINDFFGSWQNFLQSAGSWEEGTKKQNKSEIRKESFEFLKKEISSKKNKIIPPRISKAALFISDMHHPFCHQDTADFLGALKEKYKFDHIIIGGDEIDSHAMSFHDHDPDLPSPGHELEQAIESLKPIYKLFPEADVLESNHGSLFYRKGKHHGFPRHVLKSYRDIIKAPQGWNWHEEIIIQFSNGKKAVAHHGYSQNILMASKRRAMSIIQFHFHSSFSIQYWHNRDDQFFAMQCASLVDDTSLAMAYNKLTIERPINGCGGVIDGLPRLFPMILDRNNRWIGFVP